MHPRPCLLAVFLLIAAGSGHAAPPASAEAAARQYLLAESTFDLEALRSALDPQFIEISPLGEVDEHDAVLSFYAPDKKVATPPPQVDPIKIRSPHGDTAVMSTQIHWALPGRAMTMTVGMVARQTPEGWKLLSAQYTPVRPKQKPQTP